MPTEFALSCGYEKLDQKAVGGATVVVWLSTEITDASWDGFLQQTTLGQFQQSTIWARAKAIEGWKPVRVVMTSGEEIVGGFQILWRPFWWGRGGYVAKGPVALPERPGLAEYATEMLLKVCRIKRLRALIVEPPDLCNQMTVQLKGAGFMEDVVVGVNDATWIVDLSDGAEAVERQMCPQTRRKVKQAMKRGVTIREGGRNDINTFFQLMLQTCRRQGVEPVPPDERMLVELWEAARPAGCIRLTFAEYEGKPISGLIAILFGQTASFWKKGWSTLEGQRHPNELVMYEMLRWASVNAYKRADFCAFDTSLAIAMLAGQPMPNDQSDGRDAFHIRLGGGPRLLPTAYVYFQNSVIRLAYRAIFRRRLNDTTRDWQRLMSDVPVSAAGTLCDGLERAGFGSSDNPHGTA